MYTPNCSTLMQAFDEVNCLALEAPGGVKPAVYVGFRTDLQSVTFGTNGEITAMSLKTGKSLYKFKGEREKNIVNWTQVKQKPRDMFSITGELFLWPYSPAEYEALQKLALAKRAFIIYIGEDNRVKCAGIDRNPYNPGEFDDGRGFEFSVEGGEGRTFTEPKEQKVILNPMSNFFELPKLYKPASTTSAIITELDALLPE